MTFSSRCPSGGELRPIAGVRLRVMLLGAWLVAGAPVDAQAEVAAEASAAGAWHRALDAGVRGEFHVAADLWRDGDVALATGERVQWSSGQGARLPSRSSAVPGREVALLPGLRDLAFDRSGTLWVGTDRGLYRWLREGRPERVRLPGAGAMPQVEDFAVVGATVVVASTAGAYWSSEGVRFQRLDEGAIGASVGRVALRGETKRGIRAGVGGAEVWLTGSRGLTRIRGRIATAGLRITSRTRIDLPLAPGEADPIDLVVSPDGSSLLLVYPNRLAHRTLGDGERASLATAASGAGWRLTRPVLAPGAEIRSADWVDGRLVLATNRGLFEARDENAPFQRVAMELGASDCSDVSADGERGLVALCRSGALLSGPAVLQLTQVSQALRDPASGMKAASSTVPARIELAPDPSVDEIRRRAIDGAGLSRVRAHQLRASLRRRGYWPEVGLSVEAEVDRDDRRFADQAFVSGDYRSLRDRTRDRHTGFRAVVDFEWELGEIVYAEDEIDLSRELRQVTSLRDDVVDEIHQLYFERQRIRERLASGVPLAEGEATTLALRAEELWAGLDAWTGGWLSEWRRDARNASAADSSPRSPRNPQVPGASDSFRATESPTWRMQE